MFLSDGLVINVAVNKSDWRCFFKPFQNFQRTNISGVPDFIHPFKKVRNIWMHIPVGI